MKKLTNEQSKQAIGGFKWKCRNTYHSSWPGNTFVSSYHGLFSTANAAMNEHRRTYGHTDTWIAS